LGKFQECAKLSSRQRVATLKNTMYTLPFKSLGSLRNVLVFERKTLFLVH
jgi:hypothetical protein